MIRKLFIVAQGNTAAYRSLQNAVGAESDVAIIYDRRSAPGRPRRDERRQQAAIDEEVATQGWSVVHDMAAEPIRELEIAATRYNTLRAIWGKAASGTPDP